MSDVPPPAMSMEQVKALLSAPGSPFEFAEEVIRGVPTQVWKNAPPTLREVFLQGRAWGPREFMVDAEYRVTFDGFSRAVLALAADLRARGVGKGDRVAIAMRNLHEWVVAYFAATLAGAVATPLNAWWTGPELEYALADSGARAAVFDPERLGRAAPHLEGLRDLELVYVARLPGAAPDPRLIRLDDVIGLPDRWADLPEGELPAVALEPEDDCSIFYTSGTTGKPKGALATHRNNTSNILAVAWSNARTFLRRGEAPPPPPGPNDPQKSVLIAIPFFHTTACHVVVIPALFAGAKMVLMRRFEAEEAMRLIQQEKVTTAGGVPAIPWMLLEHPRFGEYDLSSLDTVSYGGAPAAPELLRRIRSGVPGATPATGWGMTETCGAHTHQQAEDYARRPDACGAPLGPYRIKVTDPDGRELPPGEVGELWAFGPNTLKGYWNKPEATAETFVDGWVRTGDLARIDEEGFCTIVDRAKDMLIRGGENIYCVEVENVLYDHPAVMDAALVGRSHDVLGEEPCAVVTVAPGMSATEQELRDHVAGRLAGFKVPVAIIVRDEPLPRNANGKILKTELKGLFG